MKMHNEFMKRKTTDKRERSSVRARKRIEALKMSRNKNLWAATGPYPLQTLQDFFLTSLRKKLEHLQNDVFWKGFEFRNKILEVAGIG